jgi:hypothetical protein
MNVLEFRRGNEFARYGGLVGNDNNHEAGGGQIAQRFDTARQKFEFRPILNESHRVLINRTIPVDKNDVF